MNPRFSSFRRPNSPLPEELNQATGLVTPPEDGQEGERLPVETVRVSMRRVVAAWGFGAAFFNLTAGAIYTSFVRALAPMSAFWDCYSLRCR